MDNCKLSLRVFENGTDIQKTAGSLSIILTIILAVMVVFKGSKYHSLLPPTLLLKDIMSENSWNHVILYIILLLISFVVTVFFFIEE